MPHRSLPIVALMLLLAACSRGGERQSPQFWQNVDAQVSPSDSWPGAPLFIRAEIGQDAIAHKLPAPPAVVLESADGRRRIRLRPRSIDLRAHQTGFVVTLGTVVPDQTLPGDYACRLITRGGDGVAAAGRIHLSPAPDPRDGALSVRLSRRGALLIENSHYTVALDRRSGLLRQLTTDPGKSPLLMDEEIDLRDPDLDASHPLGAEWSIEKQAPYYMRIVSRHALGRGILLERTLELTDSPHIQWTYLLRSDETTVYPTVTWSMACPRGSTFEVPPAEGHRLLEQDRRIITPEGRDLLYGKTGEDLWIRDPSAPLGGLDDALEGIRALGTLATDDDRLAEVVMTAGAVRDVDRDGTARRVGLAPGQALIFARVITASRQGTKNDNYFHRGTYRLLDRNPFYPGLGRLSAAVTSSSGWTFANWNNFQYAAELAPIHRQAAGARALFRDRLLSMGTYLVDRLHQDGGWPRWFAWSVYPEGARFTAHARALPFLVYLWGLLHEQEGRRDPLVDSLYTTLQETRAFFDPTSESNFTDRTDDGVPYIAYSDTYKHADLEDVREVANTHAHAYRLAHLMAEMSDLAGDGEANAAWSRILDWADRGSQRLFGDLYPASDPTTGRPIYGLIAYSRHAPDVVKLPYNGISLMGLADSLGHAGSHPLELVEIVERTTTDYRADPSVGPPDPSPEQPFLGRLYRTQPLGLALARNASEAGPHMSGLIELASLGEVLSDESGSAIHDPAMAIVIDGGAAIALTDNAFLCEWTPDYFEETPIDLIADADRFVVEPAAGETLPPGDHWAAVRRGATVEVMASAPTRLEITLSVPPGASVWRRVDAYADHRWGHGERELAGRNTGSAAREMTFEVGLAARDRGRLTIEP